MWKLILLFLALLLGGVWIVGAALYPWENPAQRHHAVILTPDFENMLRRACFDCHSNETVHPWYASLPGVSLVLRHHILEGREERNFSQWDQSVPSDQREGLLESLESMEEGGMPPTGYLLLHPSARITQTDLVNVRAALKAEFGAIPKHEKRRTAERDEEHENGKDRD